MELISIYIFFLVAALAGLVLKQRRIIEVSSMLASAVALVVSVVVAIKVASLGVFAFSFFSVDALGAIMLLIIGFVGFITTVYSVKYMRQETIKNIIGLTRVRQYFILLNLFLAAMFLAVSTSSPIFAWISIEATTLATAFLISFYNKPASIEAAWKYLIINSVGLLLGFLGTLLYFTTQSVGGVSFATWSSLLSNAPHIDPMIVKIAFVFVLIGYGTKVGLAPMHTWLPDAHSKAPVPISALLSGVLLNVAFVTILRYKVITDAVIGSGFSQNLLIIFGLLSVVVASLIIFTQKNYKRLLAYSSIENMGIMAIGFGFGGFGIFAAILHMIYHSLTKSALFLTAGNIFLKYSSTKIINVKGAINILPVSSVLFLTGFFVITGAPPFGIFLTKLSIFSSGMLAHPVVASVAIFLTAILFIGFFKHVTAMVFGEKPSEMERERESIWLIFPPFLLLVTVLYLSFFPPSFLQVLINNAVLRY